MIQFVPNNYSKPAFNAIATLFSSQQILKFNSKILAGSNTSVSFNQNIKLKEIYNSFYKLMQDNYRCEYVYKNEILRQLLLKNHASDAKFFTEVEIHDSKADALIVNGTSTVYEIKTELDNFDRLAKQLFSYQFVFDKIYVVTHQSKLNALIEVVTKDVGIMILNNDGEIQKIRAAGSNKKKTKPEYIFNLLHRSEYKKIIEEHFDFVPEVPTVKIFEECKKLFIKLKPEVAHDYMVSALRKRNTPSHREKLFNCLPDSLKLIATSGKLTRKDCEIILEKLNSKLIVD